MLSSGPIDEVVKDLADEQKMITIRLGKLDARDAAREVIARFDKVSHIRESPSGLKFVFAGTDQNQMEMLAELVAKRVPILAFEEERSNIEQVVLGLRDTERSGKP